MEKIIVCQLAAIEFHPCFHGGLVIGHGIGGINFPDKMARLAKMQDRWSKRRQTLCVI